LELTRDSDVRASHSKDASGLELVPESVARPASAEDVTDVVRDAAGSGTTITAAGSQTSMTGASITDKGVLMSMTGMNRIIDVDVDAGIARVEPGVTIGDLNRALAETGLQFAPDPTSENDATIGGAIACNASGARSLRYGPTRRHVRGLTIVYADGTIGSHTRSFLEKNTVGFAAAQDPVDWFVGSEGTLGIVVEAQLCLVPLPMNPIGLAIPFHSARSALEFVVAAREKSSRRAACLEFFDEQALEIAGTASRQPWAPETAGLIYLEDDAHDSGPDKMLDDWLAVAESRGALTADIRVFEGPQPLREARRIRHAVPATMNERGERYRASGGRKVSTDWSVPYRALGRALDAARAAAEKHGAPSPVTYGHAGNGHPHQNFIGENPEMLERIHAALEETLQVVFRMGGTFSAEHGIGKLKKGWLHSQLSDRQLEVMRSIKRALDPHGILAPGNVL